MNAVDLEAQYNNRDRVPEHPEIFARWNRDAATYRASARAEIGVPYGSGARQIYDLFTVPGGSSRPLIVFIHGGYWRSLDPGTFSHLANGLNQRGYDVAMPGYDLCPQVSIATIIRQQQQAIVSLYHRFHRPIVATGHSAGGHLAACLLATDWSSIDPSLPTAPVKAAYAISGVFDLAPLIGVSMSADLRLTEASARDGSPVFWKAPAGLPLDAVVGGDESEEFLRQSRLIADVWGERGAPTRFGAVPATNHFTVLDPLAMAQSNMTARIAQLAAA